MAAIKERVARQVSFFVEFLYLKMNFQAEQAVDNGRDQDGVGAIEGMTEHFNFS